MDQNDPASRFLQDQEEAKAEQSTRDQQSWDVNIRNGVSQALIHEGMAAKEEAKAAFWKALASLVGAFTTAAFLAILWCLLYAVVGLFR